ncbi:hypothetical protein EDI_141050 [Entamoeba dispar SAW760]|uniref:Cullin neddylation domain-containing protein n=1 Tax=Entamoeba dispar (strain ATCC PRA-260 / SAW760) TaxID=370354 RepID=B0EDW8_ENTDS|nr:uncharacterized protein EDI_141050 [Entamoeba dispar SAW760]EDR27280.1 hypothetical protein EDI_141050 [Entamoeba dispar SAW760]|eukprot:EDR27280.1 hypothetical protein EDI_141050 [Entamoeba dispar SAW760]
MNSRSLISQMLTNSIELLLKQRQLNNQQKMKILNEISDILNDDPMIREYCITIIRDQISCWLNNKWNMCNNQNQMMYIGELYSSFETIRNQVQRIFFMLEDHKKITTIYSFKETIESVWKDFFKTITLQCDLKNQLENWMKDIILKRNDDIKRFCLLVEFLSKTNERNICNEIMKESVENILSYFKEYQKSVDASIPISIQIFQFYTETINTIKLIPKQYFDYFSVFILYKLVIKQLSLIVQDLQDFWQNNDFNSLKKSIGLLNNSPLTTNELFFVQQENIKWCMNYIKKKTSNNIEINLTYLLDVFNDCYQLVKLENTIPFIKIALSQFVIEWELFKIKENEIINDLSYRISKIIDSGNLEELKKLFFIVELLPNKEVFENKYKISSIFGDKIKEFIDIPFKFNTSIFTIYQPDPMVLTQITLPSIMNSILNKWNSIYINLPQNSHKKLIFIPILSYCVLKYQFNTEINYLLHCNTIQTTILMLLNEKSCITEEELLQLSPNKDVMIKMITLLVGNKVIKEEHKTYFLDPSFISTNKITNLLQPNNQTQKPEIEIDNEQLKINKLICLVMKIMKREKSKSINELTSILLSSPQNTCFVNKRIIRKAIEFLINKGLLERVEKNELQYVF